MKKVVITAAVNGNRLDSPGLSIPVTPEEIAADAYACFQEGAAVVHFHARDVETRRSTAEVGVFAETIARIRDKCGVLIETTTGVGPKIDPVTKLPMIDPTTGLTIKPSDDERLRLLDIDPPQDLGSVAAGSLNMYNPVYPDPVIFVNTPYYMAESVKRLSTKQNVAFQFEIFDLGFLNNIERLIQQGVLKRDHGRFWLNYVLGFGGLASNARQLATASAEGERMFPGTKWGVVTPAAEHYSIAAAAAGMGADCLRTGFEDATHLPDGEPAGTNARMVAALVRIARSAGREIATPAEARVLLGLA